ncbi:hypothetical protein EMCRGX_G001203 [Ephydatia muelleri]
MRHVMEVLKKLRLHDYIAKKQATFMSQYKNCYNFTNLCYHEDDFGVATEWHFFATSHGKSAAGGIGGTVKRTSAKASLQRPKEDQILTPAQLYHFVSSEIKGGVLTAKQAAPEQTHHRSRKAKSKKRLHRRSSSSESIDTSSSSSSSLSSESSDSDAHRKKRKFPSGTSGTPSRGTAISSTFTTMVPSPLRREVRTIKNWTYSHTNPQIRTSTGASIHLGTTTGSSHHSEHTTHTPSGEEICRRFKFEKCSKGTECAFSNKCWVTDFGGDHPAKACTCATPGATFDKGAMMAKVDLKSAFKMVPKPGLRMETPWYILARAVLHRHLPPRSVPSIFNKFANAIHWILENNYGATILHYLDDFLLVGPPRTTYLPGGYVNHAPGLRENGSPSRHREQLRLPADKLQEISARRLHHYIHLNSEARADIRWWNSFLPSWNGISMFISPEWNDAESIQLFTDALAPLDFVHTSMGPGSEELFAIVAAALTWGHLLEGQRIRFHCDNLPIVQAWTNQSSKHPGVMELLRTLFFIATQHSFSLPGTPPRLTELPTGCQHQCLTSWESSRRPPEPPPAQSQ